MTMVLDVVNLTLVQNEDRLGKIIIEWVNAAVARGYTVQGSGDGLSAYQNSGQTAGPYNVFTSGTGYVTTGGTWNGSLGGANKITNARAWIRLREPSPSTREILVQRSAGTSTSFDHHVIIGIAYAGYLAGGASANTPPTSAGTSQVIYGSAFNGNGTDLLIANSSGTQIAGSNTLIVNMMFSDVAKGGNSWPFWMTWYNSTAATRGGAWVYESLSDCVSGDPDPVMMCAGTFAAVFGAPNTAPSLAYYGRRDDGTAISALCPASLSLPTFGNMPAVTPAVNPLDGKLRSFPYYVFNNVALDGRYKGKMDHFEMNMQARTYPSTLNLATAPQIYLGAMLADWETGVTPGT